MREEPLSSNAAVLARTTYAQGRCDEAEQLTRAAEEASRPSDVHGQIAWRSTRAKTLARRGEIEAGEELVREAIGFAEQSDFLNAHEDALMDLAEVLMIDERHSEAAEAIASALSLYEKKGNLVWMGKAQELLEQLTS